MTYRERREAKARRLREWADKRDAKAATQLDTAHRIADGIPMGQPILVGHHSEKRARRDAQRIDTNMRNGMENRDKAAEFRRRADGIEHAASNAIYSDDRDAAEALTARLAKLEAQRDRWKAANALARKHGLENAAVWAKGLDTNDCARAGKNIAYWPGGTNVPFPDLKNLTANIARNRKRLPALQRAAQEERATQ